MQRCSRSRVRAIRIPASWASWSGALADLLLVDGDPLAHIKLLENPGKNLVVIMKDGKIYKNTLTQ